MGLILGDTGAALPAFAEKSLDSLSAPPGRESPDDKWIPYRWCRMRLDCSFPPGITVKY